MNEEINCYRILDPETLRRQRPDPQYSTWYFLFGNFEYEVQFQVQGKFTCTKKIYFVLVLTREGPQV